MLDFSHNSQQPKTIPLTSSNGHLITKPDRLNGWLIDWLTYAFVNLDKLCKNVNLYVGKISKEMFQAY